MGKTRVARLYLRQLRQSNVNIKRRLKHSNQILCECFQSCQPKTSYRIEETVTNGQKGRLLTYHTMAEICRSNGHLKVLILSPVISEPTKENKAESGYTGRHGP